MHYIQNSIKKYLTLYKVCTVHGIKDYFGIYRWHYYLKF